MCVPLCTHLRSVRVSVKPIYIKGLRVKGSVMRDRRVPKFQLSQYSHWEQKEGMISAFKENATLKDKEAKDVQGF